MGGPLTRQTGRVGQRLALAVLAGLLLVLSAFPAAAQECPPEVDDASLRGLPFAKKDLEYEFGWNGVPAADAKVKIRALKKDGRCQYRIVIEAKTKSYIDWIWTMRDRIEVFADALTLLPFSYEFIQREGSYQQDTKIVFDQEKGEAHSTRTLSAP